MPWLWPVFASSRGWPARRMLSFGPIMIWNFFGDCRAFPDGEIEVAAEGSPCSVLYLARLGNVYHFALTGCELPFCYFRRHLPVKSGLLYIFHCRFFIFAHQGRSMRFQIL